MKSHYFLTAQAIIPYRTFFSDKLWKRLLALPLVATSLCYATAEPSRAKSFIVANVSAALNQRSPLTWPQKLPGLEGTFNSGLGPVAQVGAPARFSSQGNQITINGRTWAVAWGQWQSGAGPIRVGISDTGLAQMVGVELLNTRDATKQPVQWFSQPSAEPLILATQLTGQYRYLDITELVQKAGWQVQANGSTLQIVTPAAQVLNIRQAQRPPGSRVVVDLDRPTPWQIDQQGQDVVVTLKAETNPALLQQFKPSPTNLARDALQHSASPKVETVQGQTIIRISLPAGLRPQVTMLPNPNRLVIDIGSEVVVGRDILWAPGVRWQQQTLSVGAARFPVIWLSLDLRQPGVSLKPIWSDPATQVGIATLASTAQRWQVAAAINGGFFNRNTQLPLGVIRQDGRWLSGPILNRGAIGWNNAGEVKFGRFNLQEALITSTGKRVPVLFVNSGYAQAGVARYTPEWGPSYTSIVDNEILVAVQNNQVVAQIPAGPAGKTPFQIPPNGYLLTLRSNKSALDALPVGTTLRIESAADPADFTRYPQILGAGPLLVQNRQIVLDAKLERFSDAFIRESAVRSAIARTADGRLIIVTIQNRLGGAGPTLAETAQLMQQLGAVDALNLDGGSSTTLYLGGQLLNRSPRTAARVHNGIGVFIQPRP